VISYDIRTKILTIKDESAHECYFVRDVDSVDFSRITISAFDESGYCYDMKPCKSFHVIMSHDNDNDISRVSVDYLEGNMLLHVCGAPTIIPCVRSSMFQE